MINGSADALSNLVPSRWGAPLPTFSGPKGSEADWQINGFAADSLVQIVQNMGTDWTFDVILYPTYTRALYAVTAEHVCDISFAPFTETAARAYCGEDTGTLQGCTSPPDGEEPKARHACCADFMTSMMTTTIGALIKDSTAHAQLISGYESVWHYFFTFGYEIFQILSWTMVRIRGRACVCGHGVN